MPPVVANVDRDPQGNFVRTTIYFWADKLRVPYHSLYNATKRLGIKEIRNDYDLRRVVHAIQQRAVTFTALKDLYGDDITLSRLAEAEPVL